MELKELQASWTKLGEIDPLWAVLTDPAKRGGRWDLQEFFATGEQEIEHVLALVEEETGTFGRAAAFDFGCGVGRLSQALARRFDRVVGVDIATTMIERARELDRHGDRVEYVWNDRPDLSRFDDDAFDFVYSSLVLQHMHPVYSTGYLREMVRVLAPGGRLVFQLTSEPRVDEHAPREPHAPLPEEAFRAAVLPKQTEITAQAGSVSTLDVRIRNDSPRPWPASGVGSELPLRLGNHWLDAEGRMIAQDDGRATLSDPIAAGQHADVEIVVAIPEAPGSYLLELDLVQEGVGWFGDRGSPTARIPVEASGVADQGSDPGPERYVAMFGVPRPEVESLLVDCGARVLRVAQDAAAGPDWVSYTYCATK